MYMYQKFSLSHVSDFLKWFSNFTNIYWFNTRLIEYVKDFYAFEDSLATVTHGFDFFFSSGVEPDGGSNLNRAGYIQSVIWPDL